MSSFKNALLGITLAAGQAFAQQPAKTADSPNDSPECKTAMAAWLPVSAQATQMSKAFADLYKAESEGLKTHNMEQVTAADKKLDELRPKREEITKREQALYKQVSTKCFDIK